MTEEHIHSMLNQMYASIALVLVCDALHFDMMRSCYETQPSFAESPTLAHIGRKWLDTARATQNTQRTFNGTHFSFEGRGSLV